MKKLVCLILAVFYAAALSACNTGYTPVVTPGNTDGIYSPDPNNVYFNDDNLTTNFATDDPAFAMPNISANAGG